MSKRHVIIVTFLLIISVAIAYWNLPKTFFQQDEWWAFGIFNERASVGGLGSFLWDIVVSSGKIHFNPATELGLYFQYRLFDMKFSGYAFISIIMHIINVILVYVLVHKLLKISYLAFFSTALFGVNSITHQAVSWVATSLNSQGSLLFTLLFTLLFHHYVSQENEKKLHLYIALLSFIIALLFKETALPFILFPLIIAMYSKRKKQLIIRSIFMPTGVVLMIYGFFRIIIFLLASPVVRGVRDTLTQPDISIFIFRIFILPFRVITQSIFPQLFLLNVSKGLMKLAYPQFILSDGNPNPYIAESVMLDYLCLIIGSILILLMFVVWKILKKNKLKDLAKGLLFSFAVIIGGALAIIFIPARPGFASIIEPRHMYAGMFGTSMFIVLSIYTIFRFILRLSYWRFAMTALTLILIGFHTYSVQSDLKQLITTSTLRRTFLITIEEKYTSLPKIVVFYTQSDRPYYGMAEEVKILPLQSGFGRMLMVWYQDTELFPGCLYENAFLHGIKEEGYRYCNERGVGYFRQYESLLLALQESNLPPESVIAYNWNSKTGKFLDITSDIRNKLTNDIYAEF